MKRGLPTQPQRLDLLVIVSTALALLLWLGFPDNQLTGFALMLAGGAQFLRLSRWGGMRAVSDSLVLILHVGYAWIPIGLLFNSRSDDDDDPCRDDASNVRPYRTGSESQEGNCRSLHLCDGSRSLEGSRIPGFRVVSFASRHQRFGMDSGGDSFRGRLRTDALATARRIV